MKSKTLFLMVFLPITLIILIAGEYNVATGGFGTSFLIQGIVIYGLYSALIGGIVGGVVAGIHRAIASRRGNKDRTMPPSVPPSTTQPTA